MKQFITGGAGFIGSNYVRYILNNTDDEVTVFDALTYAGNLSTMRDVETNSRYKFVKGNICDSAAVSDAMKGHDAVVHFAAESHVDRSISGSEDFIHTNCFGTNTVIDAARKLEVNRVLHIGTDEVYGSVEVGSSLETDPLEPRSPYSASKASSDHFVRAYHDTYQMDCVISNCSNNYGSFHFPEKLIPLSINNIKNNLPIPIYGKGENVRDWLWVEDHARAIEVIFNGAKPGDTYNIGGHNEWTNIDLIHLLCKIMDEKLGREAGSSAKLITYVTDRAGHDLRYAIDSSKLQNELGWKPSLQFEEGLAKTVDWYLQNEDWLNNVTSGNYQNYYAKQYDHR